MRQVRNLVTLGIQMPPAGYAEMRPLRGEAQDVGTHLLGSRMREERSV